MSKNLMPIADPKKFLNKGEIRTARYMTGHPRNYMLNLQDGVLKLERDTPLTKSGKPFRVIPVAVRVFEAALFGNPSKKWCEFYFVNEAGHLSLFMFHGYNIDNFRAKFSELFYAGVNPCQVVWEIGFEKRYNEAAQSSYYVATFDFDELPSDSVEIVNEYVKHQIESYRHIYRSSTATSQDQTLYQVNYSDGKNPSHAEIAEDEAKHQKMLKEEFAKQ